MTDIFENHHTGILFLVGVGVALWLFISTVLKIWPFLTKVVTMVNGFVGHNGEPGLLDRVKTLEINSDHEKSNHGKMSQQLDRVESQVHILTDRFDSFTTESTQDRQRLWDIARKHHQGEIEE